MNSLKYFIITVTGLLFAMGGLTGCAPEPQGSGEGDAHGHGHGGTGDVAEEVSFTKDQILMSGIEFGDFSRVNIADHIEARGIVDLPPSNIASVNAPHEGFVRNANLLVGDFVQKGQVMARIDHPDIIALQQAYLEARAELGFLEKDFQRQQQLGESSVNSQKERDRITAEFETKKAEVSGLAARLKYIGLNPESISASELPAGISLRAPLSGYITEVNVHQGMFVQPAAELYKIVDTHHMHLELEVYEKDIHRVKKGQKITFSMPSHAGKVFSGDVHLIGRSFDSKKKTVKVHGHIDEVGEEFMQGEYVEARIMLGMAEVPALPEEALVTDDGITYLFARVNGHSHGEAAGHAHDKDADPDAHDHGDAHDHNDHGDTHDHGAEYNLKRFPVQAGPSQGDLVSVKLLKELPHGAAIVRHGAFFIMAEMKKGTESVHSHDH